MGFLFGCSRTEVPKSEIADNVNVILSDTMKRRFLNKNKKDPYGHFAAVHFCVDFTTGLIPSADQINEWEVEHNMMITLYTPNACVAKREYHIYTYKGASVRCIKTLVETEARLNSMDSVEPWAKGLNDKLVKIKDKNGILEAMKWRRAYSELPLDIPLYGISELITHRTVILDET